MKARRGMEVFAYVHGTGFRLLMDHLDHLTANEIGRSLSRRTSLGGL